MTEAETMKLIIRGTVAEADAEYQFNSYLDTLREQYREAENLGETDQAAYMMALSYLVYELA